MPGQASRKRFPRARRQARAAGPDPDLKGERMAEEQELRDEIVKLTVMVDNLRESIEHLDLSVQILGDYFEAERLLRESGSDAGTA